jgi:hypothetical protein
VSEQDPRALAAATAALLAAGSRSAASSALLSAVAIVAALSPDATRAWAFVAVLALPAFWYAMRVHFDAALFRDLARRDGDGSRDRLAQLDAALVTLGARRAEPRPLIDRVRGARRLWLRQLAIASIQLVTTLVIVVEHALRR